MAKDFLPVLSIATDMGAGDWLGDCEGLVD